MRRTTLATLTALALLVLLASSAQAQTSSTTLGEVATETSSPCQEPSVYLQTQSVTGKPSYTVPAPGGIITSWSELPLGGKEASQPPGQERLVIAAPTGAGQHTILALSPQESVSGTAVQTFAVHIPVGAGDVLGLEPVSGEVFCSFPDGLPFGSGGDLIDAISGEHLQGEMLTATSSKPELRLNLSAELQPDADHDGYGDSTEDGCPTDPATHEACSIPLISGSAQVGQTLSASPGGAPENPVYAWLRCAAGGGSCYALPGSGGLTYTVTSVDLGHTLRFRKTASNTQDTQVSESAPTALVPFASTAAIAPKLTAVSQTTAHWRAGNALARFSSATGALGTTFRFTLNLPVAVTLTFRQEASGRLVSGKCVAQTTHNEHRSHCTRTVTLGALHSAAHIGKNTVSFQGRISRSVRLTPGLYTVTITAGSPGQHTVSKSLTFRILSR